MKLVGTYGFNEEFASEIRTQLNLSYSDKASMHEYENIYAHLLQGRTVENFLEIGLFLNDLQHTDLTAWAQIFPSASIYGGDMKTEQLFNRDNIQMVYVDQNNPVALASLVSVFGVEFDVILDDASHMFGSTICTFENLFPALRSGGIYMIEDCQLEHPDNNGWQQTVGALSSYFSTNNYTFEVFQSRAPQKKTDPETGEETEFEHSSDDYVICIFK